MSNQKKQITFKTKRQLWVFHIETWGKSNLTQAEYCRRNQLASKSFTYWKGKLKKEKTSSRFLPVPLKTMPFPIKEKRAHDLTLVFDDKFKIEVGDEFNASTLVRLVHALRGGV